MTKNLLGSVIAAALLVPLAIQAQTLPPASFPLLMVQASAKRPITNIQGQVVAVDTARNTVTLSGRRGKAATTLTLTPDTKVYMTQSATLTDVKPGDTIDAYRMPRR